METDDALTPREAALRSAATVCLVGIALVQAIALPPVFSKGTQFAVLTMAAMALCVSLVMALAATPARAGPGPWRTVAAAGVLVLAGWAASHTFAVPGLTGARGDWTAMPGGVAAALAAGCIALAVAAARPTKGSVRTLLTAGVVLVALMPSAGAFLVGLGPGPPGGEAVLDGGAHHHPLTNPEQFRYIFGPHGRQLVREVKTPARQTPFGALAAAVAALLFAFGAIDRLRRRSAPAAPPARALGSGAP